MKEKRRHVNMHTVEELADFILQRKKPLKITALLCDYLSVKADEAPRESGFSKQNAG